MFDIKEPQHSLVHDLRRLWKHISRLRRLQLVGLGVLMLLGALAELFSLGMVVPFLGAITSPERVFDHPWAQPLISGLGLIAPGQLLLPFTILFGLAAVLAGITRLFLLWGQMRSGNAIGNDLGTAAYRLTLYQPYSVHAARNSSEVLAVLMTKINTVVYFIVIPCLMLFTSAFMVLTIFALMLTVDAELTLMAFLGFGCIYTVVAYSTKKSLASDSQNITLKQNEVAQVVQEGLGGIRDVLIDGLQETYARIYREADGKMRYSLGNVAIIGGVPRPIIESLGLMLIGGLAYLLVTRQGGMATALPILGAVALAAQRLLPLIQQGYSSYTSLLGGKASLCDVLLLLEQQVPECNNQVAQSPIKFTRHITLEDLHFTYDAQDSAVLCGINLDIPRGSKIGFSGPTGSGKSTLVDIIMGLLEPTSGSLLIDGVKLEDENILAWQAHVAHVPQVIYLADATIAENIAFGLLPQQINQERVREAAERAQIADAIDSWPAGYGTYVGERGVRLSGGQRQRIGIARALYKQADVIVFDEATSALDNDTERAVMESIYSLSKELTILVVAHRLSTLKKCDQIVELSEGLISSGDRKVRQIQP